ncbi:hypothetical protein FBY40_2438 [Microbacterium sp. SLBN-154]|nr:hypothetical protein FBY40_2438 [Microbacterium sp. SLBN-154]
MLRLDPAFPPLWRSPWAVQFGLDAVATLTTPTVWQERLLHELGNGLPAAALPLVAASLGAPAGAAEDFLAEISPALERPRSASPTRAVIQVGDDVAPAVIETLQDAMACCGLAWERAVWPGDPPSDPAVPVIALAAHLVHPARAAALMAADVTHLPFIVAGSRVRVGPLVVPGVTACLSCVALTATDADGGWPLLAAQLCGRPISDVSATLLVEAAARAVRLLSGEGTTPSTTTELVLTTASALRSRRHRPHEQCGCRSPAGSATGVDHALRATSSDPRSARPA